MDPLLSIYKMSLMNMNYIVKLRPFFLDFFLTIQQDYEVYFYTAGNRPYGEIILDILKLELKLNLEDAEY